MTKTYFPFDSGAGSNITEAQWRKMAEHWRSTGVLKNELNQAEVFGDASGMNVKVKSGKVWIKGHYFESDAQETIAIAAADATNPRIDRVIVRVDFTANTIDFAVLQGVPAVAPAAPALTQSTSQWEISLAQVRVEATVLNIAADKVTDERTFSSQGVGLADDNRWTGQQSFEAPGDVAGLPYSALIDEATTNHVTNPSFEVDTAGWTALGGGSIARDTAQAFLGAASLRINVATGANFNGAGFSPGATAASGQSWSGALWAKASATKTVRFYLRFYDGAGAVLGNNNFQLSLGTGWQRLQISNKVAPANTATVRLEITNDNIDQGAFSIYIDAAQLEQKSYATTYADGSLGPGYAWTGTVHASTSTRTAGVKVLGRATGDSFALGAGRLLASKSHKPASQLSTTSTAYVDVDATNLAASFVAPASGKVLARMSAVIAVSATTVNMDWRFEKELRI